MGGCKVALPCGPGVPHRAAGNAGHMDQPRGGQLWWPQRPRAEVQPRVNGGRGKAGWLQRGRGDSGGLGCVVWVGRGVM